ncbi:MAG: DUF4340 domain-containing protein [Verrucomicrobiota bacterium]|nr:DUF4340 domain-containing protein [Verrucomicrobiota bacterium]
MRLKLTLILLLLNVALFTAIFQIERAQPNKDAFEITKRLVLPVGFAQEATKIEVNIASTSTRWVLEKREGTWFIVEPVLWPANPFAVSRLIGQLQFLEWEKSFPVDEAVQAGLSLSNYGLSRPRAEISLTNKSETHTLQLGQPTEVGNRIYILGDDRNTIRVVDRDLLTSVELNVESMRDSRVFHLTPFSVRSLAMVTGTAAGQRVRLIRNADEWAFESPMQAQADTAQVNASLAILTAMEIASFEPSELARQGLTNPMRLTLAADNKRETLLIGSVVPESKPERLFAQIEERPTVFTVPAEVIDIWRTSQESLRERHVFKLKPSEVSGIEIGQGDRLIKLQRLESGGWQIVFNDGKNQLSTLPADPSVLDTILAALGSFQIQRFGTDAPSTVDIDASELNNPQRRITVQGATERTLLVGGYEAATNLFNARIEGTNSLFKIKPDVLLLLPMQPLHYRQRTLYELPRTTVIRKVIITDRITGERLLDKSLPASSTEWQSTIDQEPEDKRLSLQTILDYARRFKVVQYLVQTPGDALIMDKDTTHPWRYKMEVQVELPSGSGEIETQTREFLLTERIGGTTQYGGYTELGLTFIIEQKLIDALHPILFLEKIPAPQVLPQPAETAPAVAPALAPAVSPVPATSP